MNEVLIEQIAIYGTVFFLCALTIFFYMRKKKVSSLVIEKKVTIAKEEGLSGFYQGFMLAVDSLKQQGLSINLHVFDTQNDTARIKEILNFPEFENNDLIIGPMYNHEVKLVSEYSKENQIKMISPLSDNLNLVNENPYLFQVKPSYNSQIDEFAFEIMDRDFWIIIVLRIACL